MLGLILCGGQSQRMGTDKGLLQKGEKNWAVIARDTMAALDIPVKISVNEQQVSVYEKIFAANDLVIDNASLSVRGPLLGVLSCHLAFPDQDIFILACDMPLMDTSVLRSLQAVCKTEQDAETFVFINGGEAEPLCGIYRSTGLARVHHALRQGEWQKHSMKFLLDQLGGIKVPLEATEKKYFSNVNTGADWSSL